MQACALFLLWNLIQAFVHPTSFVFGQWIDQTKKVKTLQIRQETTLYDPALPGGSATVEEDIWIRKPTFFRRSSRYPKGRVDWVSTPNRAVRISGGKIENLTPFDVYGAVGLFFLPDSSRRLSLLLTQVGVDASAPRWALRDKRVLYELGPSAGAQVWFTKDDWLPAGVKARNSEQKLTVSLPSRFAVPYPDRIEAFVDGKPVEQTRVISVKENVQIPDSVFDLTLLRNARQTK